MTNWIICYITFRISMSLVDRKRTLCRAKLFGTWLFKLIKARLILQYYFQKHKWLWRNYSVNLVNKDGKLSWSLQGIYNIWSILSVRKTFFSQSSTIWRIRPENFHARCVRTMDASLSDGDHWISKKRRSIMVSVYSHIRIFSSFQIRAGPLLPDRISLSDL